MIRPYELYVRFLVTKGFEELDAVNGHLQEIQLLPITQEYWEKIYNLVQDRLPAPITRQITEKRYEGDFLRWMRILEVHELWQLEKQFRTPENCGLKLVYDIHYDPHIRLAINAMLMKACKPEDIAQAINAKYSYMLKPTHVDVYWRFFWDPRRMSRASWRQYLESADSMEKDILFTALTEPLDVVKTRLDLPAKAHVSDQIQFLLTNAYQKAKHYLRLSTKEANAEARQWIAAVLQLSDKYEKYRTGDVDDFGKNLQMEFDYVQQEFPTPDENTLAELRSALEKGEKQ